jgi:FxLD family lantipeptide
VTIQMDHLVVSSGASAADQEGMQDMVGVLPLGSTGTTSSADLDFDLDITIVESGEVTHELLRMTDDGCGQTCQSACSTSCP